MKNLLFLIAAISLMMFACKTEKQGVPVDETVPPVVKKAFKKSFPQAKAVEWSEEGGYFEAEYEEEGMEREVVFDEKGKIIFTETEIAPAELPAAITDYLTSNHPNHAVKEVDKIIKGELVSFDVLIVENGQAKELNFDSNGNLLGQELEDNDEDDEDDGEGEKG